MDTRSKILSREAALEAAAAWRASGRPLAVVTGYFDGLLAADARLVESVARRTPGAVVMAILLPPPDPVLTPRARAELAAALAVLDYVVIAEETGGGNLVSELRPDVLVCAEQEQEHRMRQLIRSVHRRQGA